MSASDSPLELYYTAPCALVLWFQTDNIGFEDFGCKDVQILLIEAYDHRVLLLCVLVHTEAAVYGLSLPISNESMSSIQMLGSDMLSMRMGTSGVFLSFPDGEIMQDFLGELDKWLSRNGATYTSKEDVACMFRMPKPATANGTDDHHATDNTPISVTDGPGATCMAGVEGPVIGGVDSGTAIKFFLNRLAAIEAARLKEGAKMISGSADSLELEGWHWFR